MPSHQSVLIVDRSEETQEVLQTVLERRGVRTLAANRTKTAAELAQQHHPDLIVLDMETCGDDVAPILGNMTKAGSLDCVNQPAATLSDVRRHINPG